MLFKHRSKTKPVGSKFLHANTWIVLSWERLWPLLVPAFMVACAFLIFTWAGGWRALHHENYSIVLWIARIGFAAAFIASLLPLRNFINPQRDEIVRQVETKSDMENRPITAQDDKLVMGSNDAFADILWQEHQSRMSSAMQDMTAGAPGPKANRFDPFAVRAILPILAFAAFFFSFSPQGGKFSDIYETRQSAAELLTRMDAWINPPAYTKKPPVYLVLDKNDATPKSYVMPEGSDFFLRFIGEGDVTINVETAGGSAPIEPTENGASKLETEFTFGLSEDSVIRLLHREKEIAQWAVSLTEDKEPTVSFFEDPSASLSGSLELTYNVKDDYGVVSAEGKITSLEPLKPNARPLVGAPQLDLPLPRKRAKDGLSKVNRDLSDHPWAGSKIGIQIFVKDDIEQSGKTEIHEMILPGRRFSKPLARALVDQRLMLALDANQQTYVANLLDAVSGAAPDFIDNSSALLGMRVAYRRIVDARNDDDLRSVLDLLWDIALAVEFGDLSEVERRLREAQEALSEALQDGASSEEIERLMDELRQAMNEMMQALAEQARQNPQAQNPFDPNSQTQTLTQNDLERMMDQIEDLAKSGSEDAARQMLSELQRMMDNLRAGQHQQQRQAEGNEFNEALDQLSELMQRQQELMNETFQMQRQREQGLRQNPRNGQQEQQGQQGQQQQGQQRQGDQQQGEQSGQQPGDQNQPGSGQMTQEEFAEALRQLQEQQQALEQQLSELGEQLESLGLGESQELGEAQREMGQAGENLGQGEAGSAANDQAQALEALRRGAQNMMQQMAGDRQQGGQQQSQRGGQGGQQQSQSQDPLGRNRDGENGLNADSDVKVPGEIDAQRARQILEAIRKRLSIPENPIIEKEYLERLLESLQ